MRLVIVLGVTDLLQPSLKEASYSLVPGEYFFYRATHCVQVRYLQSDTASQKDIIMLLLVVSSSANFWATVCETVRPMLSDRCMSCL